jgi:ABC-type phosphate/phosphonate transport system permease subunit
VANSSTHARGILIITIVTVSVLDNASQRLRKLFV